MARRSTTVGGARKPRRREVAKAGVALTKVAKAKVAKTKLARTWANKRQRKPSPLAELRATLELRSEELKDAREQQAATAKILDVIANSPAELEPVFGAVLENAIRICNAGFGTLLRYDGREFYFAADSATPPALAEYVRRPGPFRGLPGGMVDRILKTRQVQHAADYTTEASAGLAATLGGARSTLGVPILKGDILLGALVIYRQEVRPFTQREIALVQGFATQAAIAMDNAHLFNETKQALERQAAGAEILSTIAGAPGDAGRSLQQIAETSARLFGAPSVSIQLAENGEWGEAYRYGTSAQNIRSAVPLSAIRIGGPNMPGWVVGNNRQLHIPDLDNLDPSLADFPGLPHARAAGTRTMCGTPLRHGGKAIGVLIVYRDRLLPFTAEELALQQSFADQAVIAIENARLFDEVQARTRDLEEALQQQTATADVLKVISRTAFDLDAVMHTLARSAAELCAANLCGLYVREGKLLVCRGYTAVSKAQEDFVRQTPIPADDNTYAVSRALSLGEVANIGDFDQDRSVATRAFQQKLGFKALLIVPLMRDGHGIGLFVIGRDRVGDFSPRHVELVQTFADQAVIAIENARLFNETKQALERQAAGAEILSTIASAPGDAARSLQQIAEISARLFGAPSVSIQLAEGTEFTREYRVGGIAQRVGSAYPRSNIKVGGRNLPGTVVAENRQIHIPDLDHLDPSMSDFPGLPHARAGGARTVCGTPLRREGKSIGALIIFRDRLLPFTAEELALQQSFADQAVIAIENDRLFNETKEALERQTATSEVLNVIAGSPTETQPVFDAIARSAAELCEGTNSGIFRLQDGFVHLVGHHNISPEQLESGNRAFPAPVSRGFMAGRAILARAVAHVPDIAADPEYTADAVVKAGFRAAISVPMMRNGEPIGAINVTREEARPFSARQIELLCTFADQAVIAIENTRLFNEVEAKTRDLSEALEQQTATSEVLAVISRSPSDLNPVLEAISDTAARLCGSEQTMFFRYDGAVFRILASWNFPPEVHEMLERRPLMPGHPSAIGRAGASLKPVCIPDVLADPAYGLTGEQNRARYRATLAVPLLREGRLVGALSLNRSEPGAFTEKQIELVATFADQAVIAIENVRLFEQVQARTRDLTESLERQTATADILKVIASSPSDVQPVFDAVVLTARRLLGREIAAILLRNDDATFGPRAITGPDGLIPIRNPDPIEIDPEANFPSRAIVSKKNQHLPDWSAIDLPDEERKIREMYGLNSALYLPMLRGDECIGVLLLGGTRPGSFSEADVALAESFRDQAVIAIENSRLFNETREALERQTATADILKVIARSPDDVQPVFQAIADRSNRLVDGFATTVVSIIDDVVHLSAFTLTTPEADAAMRAFYPRPLSGFSYSDAIRRGEIYRIVDAEDELAGDADSLTMVRQRGWRSALWVPLLLEGEPIGIIGATRVEPGPFADHHVEMLKTFADQAVIAIQNTRLFNQTQEALERQTATADILRVIASSPDDVQPVFQAIAERSNRLVSGLSTTVLSVVGDLIELSAFTRTTAEADAALIASFPRQLSSMPFGEAIRRGEIYSLPDTETEPALRELARMRGYRSMLFVPLLHDGAPIGMIGQTRVEAGPFAANHIDMLKTFADQAVIAIQNVKLFEEVQAKTAELAARNDAFQERIEYQSATIDVLKTMSASPGDAAPVFDLIVAQAEAVCGADAAGLLELVGTQVHLRSVRGKNRVAVDAYRASFPRPIARDSIVSRAMLEAKIVYLEQAVNDAELSPQARGITGKASLGVPIIRDGIVIGGMGMTTANPNGFSEGQIELLNTFAEQAAIAIASAETFRRLQERTSELTKSLDDLRTAQDRLVQTEKLASLGQLTAGIAHEIKNPLNFVNNFAALSAELVDEMNDVLADASLEAKKREDIDEIRELLKSNLEKVVQHGKRADSIVKNMLLHSRSGSGEQRSADVNALIDESLNLAYHGARAEQQGFNITLVRDFDPAVGAADIYPQEITRVFLNLITNGFYAAAKRAAQAGNGFEPVLKAATKDLGDRVEIRIRDNGTGIPPEVKDKIFNPFFTTKPAGEGTGLGLSMSHDIVVKQHGGTIDLTTEPGAFTEFIITLPRRAPAPDAAGGPGH
jgi:GAF domain-containing protein